MASPIKKRYRKVIRVKDMARISLSGWVMNPGAIRITRYLLKIIPAIVKRKRMIIKRESKLLPILKRTSLSLRYSERTGVATESLKPSANMLLNKLGNLNATIKASRIAEVPKKFATITSRTNPKMRETRVPKLKIDVFFTTFLNI